MTTRKVFMPTVGKTGAANAGSPNRHVVPSATGWDVREPGSKVALMSFATKAEAITEARNQCRELKGELFIHGKNGKIQSRDSYGNDPVGRG